MELKWNMDRPHQGEIQQRMEPLILFAQSRPGTRFRFEVLFRGFCHTSALRVLEIDRDNWHDDHFVEHETLADHS